MFKNFTKIFGSGISISFISWLIVYFYNNILAKEIFILGICLTILFSVFGSLLSMLYEDK